MISEKMAKALNEQMNFENESAHVYLAMASWLRSEDLDGASSFMIAQYKEEKGHGRKIYDYLHEQDWMPTITSFQTPESSFENILEVLESAYAHEQKVTAKFIELMDLARLEKDYATEALLQWFISEQVEEEDTIRGLIARYHKYPKAHLLLFDKDMGSMRD